MSTPASLPPFPAPDDLVRWLGAARHGSAEDLGRILEACRMYLMLVAETELGSTLRPKAGASDLVQESLLDAHRGFAQFRGGTRDELLAWLRQILRYNLADLGRRHRGAASRAVAREEPLAAGPHATLTPGPAEQLVAAETADRVRAAVAGLPDEARSVLNGRHQEGLSWEEVGARIGKSPEAARKVWFRAVERLRQVLESGHDTGG